MYGSGVRLSVCLSHRSTAAAAAGWRLQQILVDSAGSALSSKAGSAS